MATTYTIKTTRNNAVVKIVGGGSTTIPLVNLALDDQVFDSGNASVAISRILYSLSSSATIARGSNTTIALAPGNYNLHFASAGAATDLDLEKDITITTTGDINTVIVVLNKQSGYIDPDFQNMSSWELLDENN